MKSLRQHKRCQVKTKAIICDLDGTLCNDDHRKEAIKDIVGAAKWGEKEYNRYYELMDKDTPFTHISDILHRFEDDHQIIFMTGRPLRFSDTTRKWFSEHMSLKNKPILLMRQDNDYRCDTVVKTELYEEMIKPHFDVQFVLEDRKRVVKMWRSLGLKCLEVAEADF